MLLEGKVALVTGAGRGIGRSIAWAFARHGCHIAALARSANEINETADEVRRLGRRAVALMGDVSVPADVEAAVGAVLADFGRIDLLVNNAGYAHFQPIKDLPLDEWRRTLDVNLTGPFLCIKAVLPSMIGRRSGRIINISSVAGLKPYEHQGAYCASKHGLIGLGLVLAMELREYGISVHTVCPGGVPTRLTEDAMPERDKSDWMAPEDVAETCLYLATLSPRAAVDVITVRRFTAAPVV